MALLQWLCVCVLRFRTPFRRVPVIGGREIDLYLLYSLVTAQGGWIKVCPLPSPSPSHSVPFRFVYCSARVADLECFGYKTVAAFGRERNPTDSFRLIKVCGCACVRVCVRCPRGANGKVRVVSFYRDRPASFAEPTQYPPPTNNRTCTSTDRAARRWWSRTNTLRTFC